MLDDESPISTSLLIHGSARSIINLFYHTLLGYEDLSKKQETELEVLEKIVIVFRDSRGKIQYVTTQWLWAILKLIEIHLERSKDC